MEQIIEWVYGQVVGFMDALKGFLAVNLFTTLYGAFAQSESESISKNVSWGKRQAMREGKAILLRLCYCPSCKEGRAWTTYSPNC